MMIENRGRERSESRMEGLNAFITGSTPRSFDPNAQHYVPTAHGHVHEECVQIDPEIANVRS